MSAPTSEETRRYQAHFAALDTANSGVLTYDQARPLFERAGMDAAVIDRLWARVAPSGARSSIDREGFVTVLHLATLAMQGRELPESSAAADDPWALPNDAAAKYDSYFALLDAGGGGAVSGAQAEPLFERAELPSREMTLIWSLADVDLDGRLSMCEFRVAMHLATLAVQGWPLPARLPPVLEREARGLGSGRGAAALPNADGGAVVDPRGSAHGGSSATLRPIAPHDLAHYRAIFLAAEAERGMGVDGEVGSRVLAQSGLPDSDLAHIWELADLDADGRLTLDEFAIAMHLVTRRLAGDTLPHVLPPSLAPPFAWVAAQHASDSLALGVTWPSSGAAMAASTAPAFAVAAATAPEPTWAMSCAPRARALLAAATHARRSPRASCHAPHPSRAARRAPHLLLVACRR